MKLVRIFAHEKNMLYSIRFDNDVNEFRKAFDQWDDVEYLRHFFEENKSDLQSGFYGNISVEEAVFDTIAEGAAFEEYIRNEAKKGANDNQPNLNNILFKTLNKYEKSVVLEKNKAYGVAYNSWLRIYAIRICADIFVVSGSAIKLTGEMKDRVHTQKELDKLKQTSQYLKNNGFMDADDYGFIDIN